MLAQPTSAASCRPMLGGGTPDAGTDYGATMYNTGGNDDDCKYVVNWSATPIAPEEDVTFTVAVVNTVDRHRRRGRIPMPRSICPLRTTSSPSTNPPVTESTPGSTPSVR